MSQNDFRVGRNHSTQQKASPMKQNPSVLGIDLAKRIFHLVGMDDAGHVVLRKRLTRDALMPYIAQLPPAVIGMEACGGAHYWARRFRTHGHTVKLIAPQFVKPYVKSNKNDPADAEAICEAVTRPTMRFVPIKEVDQQDLQSLHRARERVVKARIALVNEIRGLLAEYGIVLPQSVTQFRHTFLATLEAERTQLTPLSTELFGQLYDEFGALEKRLAYYTAKIEAIGAAHPVCQRLMTIPEIGPLTATALVAAVSNASAFKNGRQFAAWIGLVPRQHSTGGKPRLLGISKAGTCTSGPSSSMAHVRRCAGSGSRRTAAARGSEASWIVAARTRQPWPSRIKMQGLPGYCSRPTKCTSPSRRQPREARDKRL
jgi:transposase